jgi:hypothetical protein
VKCLVLKGLADGQAYLVELMKYIFTYLQNVIGNSSAMIHVPRVASKQGTPTISKPTMNQYKATTRVHYINEPFVDWYEAETEEQARTMWESDRETYDLPVDAIVKFEKQ